VKNVHVHQGLDLEFRVRYLEAALYLLIFSNKQTLRALHVYLNLVYNSVLTILFDVSLSFNHFLKQKQEHLPQTTVTEK
jgi:hypothetical protein